MENINTKYPRTYHVPFSPGTTSDDRILHGDWFANYKGKEIVVTEKLDGENTAMNLIDVFARSHGAPTRSPWSRNLWDPADGLYWKIKPYIGENETLYGENLYGEHSIHYENINSYWHLFGINDGERWYGWNEVKDFAEIIGVQHVPELWVGFVNDEDEFKKLIENFTSMPSVYGDTREGVVVRLTDSFPIDEFPNCVCKWVRPHHVQTDTHWTRNWKKAELVGYKSSENGNNSVQ